MKKLILTSSGLENDRIELTPEKLPIVMGRSRSADVTVSDRLLSRRHAEIRLNDMGQFVICDLDSTNLTIVNEKDVSVHILQTGDRILLGETVIEVTVEMPDPEFNEKTTREIDLMSDADA